MGKVSHDRTREEEEEGRGEEGTNAGRMRFREAGRPVDFLTGRRGGV